MKGGEAVKEISTYGAFFGVLFGFPEKLRISEDFVNHEIEFAIA
jgi:hypothetical protein